jgi:hypothetical protein
MCFKDSESVSGLLTAFPSKAKKKRGKHHLASEEVVKDIFP